MHLLITFLRYHSATGSGLVALNQFMLEIHDLCTAWRNPCCQKSSNKKIIRSEVELAIDTGNI